MLRPVPKTITNFGGITMPKKNLLISAALTTFILVIAASVASAYKGASTVVASFQPTAVAVAPGAIVAAAPTEAVPPVRVTHQEAAIVAANYLGQTDIYSVENAIWNGVDAYKVVFSSGDIVYVGLFGEVLGSEAPQTVFVNNNTGGNSNNVPQQSSRREQDEHEEHDDD
jgi:hypothetical protein